MSRRRLPPDAFAYYVALGDGRSYEAVAQHFGVAKSTVVTRAQREDWQLRLEEMERTLRQKAAEKARESIEDLNNRHTKILKAVQAKALEALKAMPLTSAMDAVRALDICIKQERLIAGEPTERTASEIEAKILAEHERWLVDA